MKSKLKLLLPIIIAISFAIFAGFSLLHKGLPPTHDGEYHIVRFFLFNEVINEGNIYPRWADHLNNGFGVPLFNFVYPLPNYIASFFHQLGISFIDSFKLEIFTATIVGGLFFYLWAKEFWGKMGAVVSSIFYTFSPYHFVDIYIRGSVGEVWALAFFPAFLWAYTLFVKKNNSLFFALSSIFFSLIIFSHNILSLMFAPFAIFYVLFLLFFNKSIRKLVVKSLFIFVLGLGLSAIFWMPAIYETKYVVGLQVFNVVSSFPELYQLIIPSWGSGFSGAGLGSELSYQIGLANLFVVFLSTAVIFLQKKRREKKVLFTFFFLVWFVLVFFLMLKVSLPIWNITPFMKFFQFPWRLLSIEILFASFLAGSIFSVIRNNVIKTFFALFLIFFTFILGIGYAKPAYYLYRNDTYYTTRSNFIDGTNSPGNVFNTVLLKKIPDKQIKRAVFLKGTGTIMMNESRSNMYSFEINGSKNSEILLNLAYYPGWEVFINNKTIKIKETQNGFFSFPIPSGKSRVKVIFNDTLIRKFSALISLTSLILIFNFVYKTKVCYN